MTFENFFQAALAEVRRERERDQEAWEEERLERQRERERESTEAALALEREREREREERERERELKVSRKWLRFSEFLQFEERGRKQEQAHILKKKKCHCVGTTVYLDGIQTVYYLNSRV